jgi:hypothetical protein
VKHARLFAAAFDAAAMAIVAYFETSGRFAATLAELVVWGAVLAAVLCALVIAADGPAMPAWIAIGYVLFGGLLTAGSPHLGLLLLALALMPLVPRPRGSLALGLGTAAIAALSARLLIALAP